MDKQMDRQSVACPDAFAQLKPMMILPVDKRDKQTGNFYLG